MLFDFFLTFLTLKNNLKRLNTKRQKKRLQGVFVLNFSWGGGRRRFDHFSWGGRKPWIHCHTAFLKLRHCFVQHTSNNSKVPPNGRALSPLVGQTLGVLWIARRAGTYKQAPLQKKSPARVCYFDKTPLSWGGFTVGSYDKYIAIFFGGGCPSMWPSKNFPPAAGLFPCVWGAKKNNAISVDSAHLM